MAKSAYIAVEKTAMHFDKLFEYKIPKNMESEISIGSRVLIPFGATNKLRQGMVLKIEKESLAESMLKSVNSVLSGSETISNDILKLVSYLHSSCFCTWYEAVKTVFPIGLTYKIDDEFVWNNKTKEEASYTNDAIKAIKKIEAQQDKKKKEDLFSKLDKSIKDELIKKEKVIFKKTTRRNVSDKNIKMVRLKVEENEAVKLTSKQKEVYDFLKEQDVASVKEVCYFCCVTKAVIVNMVSKGIVERYDKEVLRTPTNFVTNKKKIDEIELTKEQQEAYLGLEKLREKENYNVSLLKGVTGSGKTMIFIKLIKKVLDKGKQAILLVPEIALTPQLVEHFNSYFGEKIAVLHSGLSMGEKLDEYKRIQRNQAQIVIGTRSAVFAPLNDIGIIIMDEEGEYSYKSTDMSPRYHARDVAKYRCKKSKGLLVLASATPSIESAYFAKKNVYKLFELKKRYKKESLPEVMIIDRSIHPSSLIDGVSLPLSEQMKINLENKQQSILLLNRRGYNSSAFCIDCGYIKQCDSCCASMTYHKSNNSLICHYCGNIEKPFKRCPVCGSEHIMYTGHGTQKIEEDLKEAFPSAKIMRMDADTTFSRLDLERQIKEFENGDYDILIGTQIVAKGLNFPNVTLVGVLSADSLLYGADFRCRENLFSILTQVVGRSGRGNLKGRAVIQTYSPENATIIQAAKQDYNSFYNDEIKERKGFFCPPFCDLCSVGFSGTNENKTMEAARKFLDVCKKTACENVPIIMLGISSPYMFKLKNRYRKRLILKCRANRDFIVWMKQTANRALKDRVFSNIKVAIDINGEIV